MEHPGKSNSSTMTNAGISSGIRGGEFENLSRDRLVYLTTCLIGHHVEVQVTNGSVLTGIFHASNAGDFGVVLKMAHVIKDVSTRGRRAASDLDSKALIIPAHEVVQVVAKDVSITSDEQSIEVQGLKRRDIMLDSYLSQSHHVELERELQPWMPDEDDPQCPELESIFDSLWTGRSWDQFKVNEALFGVKSTFDEELYTTKLEKGPQMWNLEEEAMRIAREIEGEETHDLHLAEERGIYAHGNLDVDEETKYSSVQRRVDDSGCADGDVFLSSSGSLPKVNEDVQTAKSDDSQYLWDVKRDGCENACVSSVAEKGEHKTSSGKLSEDLSGKVQVTVELTNHHGQPEIASAPRFPPVSPTSSIGSLSSEKSTLNPNAKEFKLNPNAKSFVPSQSSLRPVSPANNGSFYYPATNPTMPAGPHMQGMPVGMGVGPSFAGHQAVLFNPQATAMQYPQAYFPANVPQYGQPMILGGPRPVMYMPGYSTN